MAKLLWDQSGDRTYETGTDRGVLFPMGTDGGYENGVAWNGLTSVSENPTGAEPNPLYADNIKYLNLISAEEFGATVEAYTYPPEFALCDGSAEIAPGVTIGQQVRRKFGLSYRTTIGNDVRGNDYGYKIHLIYNATAQPSQKAYQTINESPDAITFSWEISTEPIEIPGFRPSASITIDSTKVPSAKLAELEDLLYGTAAEESSLPLPAALIALFGEAAGG